MFIFAIYCWCFHVLVLFIFTFHCLFHLSWIHILFFTHFREKKSWKNQQKKIWHLFGEIPLTKYFITFKHVFMLFTFYNMRSFSEEQNVIFFPQTVQQLMTWLLNVKQKDTSVFVYLGFSISCFAREWW